MAASPPGTIAVTGADLERLVDAATQKVITSAAEAAAEKVIMAAAAAEAAGGDDDLVIVRLTKRELREVREAAQFYARAGYGLSFLEKLGKWLAAVAAIGVFIKMAFPHLFNGGKP